MSNSSIVMGCEPLKGIGFASIDGDFNPVKDDNNDPVPLQHDSRVLIIQNATDKPVIISYDGINKHLVLLAQAQQTLDITSNHTQGTQGFFLRAGTYVYVKQLSTQPTKGDVYVTSYYGA